MSKMSRPIVPKLLLVGAITLGLFIPLHMIRGLVHERSRFRDQARTDVAQAWTGPQQILGPLLHVSMLVHEDVEGPFPEQPRKLHRLLIPGELSVAAELRTETRKRGLYEVPVYRTGLVLEGWFDTSGLALPAGSTRRLAVDEATIAMSISDNRGIVSPPQVVWNGESRVVESGSGLPQGNGVRAQVGPVDPQSQDRYPFRVELELRGMQSLSFVPLARDMRVGLDAAWPHPSFTGRFLPMEYAIEEDRFQAEWRLSHLATQADELLQQMAAGNADAVQGHAFGVSLISPVDIYQQATRSVKYGSLFVLLTFTGFFVVELTRKLMLHPMQYLLVGLALVIFFLLLLSLSEHMAFGLAYFVSALACVGLVGFYLSASLGGTSTGLSMVGVLGGLYGMLYAILTSEHNALLMGSLLLFSALAAVMLVTRKLDWYTLAGVARTDATPGHGISTNP